MPAQTSKTPGDGSGTLSYTLASDSFDIESVYATIDATTATGPVTAELTVRDQSGVVIARKKQAATIPAGATGSATWALRLDDDPAAAAATSAYMTVQDEGVALPQETKINFVGAGVTATDDAANGRTKVTIPGGGGGGIQFDTNPQSGHWLYIATTTTPPSTRSIEIHSGGDMLLESLNDQLLLHGGSVEIATTVGGGGIALSAYQINAVVNPAGGSMFFQSPEIDLAYGAGGVTIFDPAFGSALKVLDVGGVTEYHIKAGAVWVADL